MMSEGIKNEQQTKLKDFEAFLKSGDESQVEYWKAWAENFNKKIDTYNKSIAVRDKAMAVDVFNKTVSDQAFKDYSVLSRIDYSFSEFITNATMAFASDKAVKANQKMLDRQKTNYQKL